MTLPVARPPGDPGALTAAARCLRSALAFTDGALASGRRGAELALDRWASPVADDFRAVSGTWLGELQGVRDHLAGVDADLDGAATTLADAQSAYDALRADWERAAPDDPVRAALEDRAERLRDDTARALDGVGRRLQALTEQVVEGGSALSPAALWQSVIARSGHVVPSYAAHLRAAVPGGRDALVPPRAGGPAAAAAWWRGLDRAEQAWLIAEAPERIGGLDGVPFAARDLANRGRLDDERARLEQEGARLRAALDGTHPWLTDDDAELQVVQGKLAALDRVEEVLARPGTYRSLLLLDLTDAQAMAAIGYGDVDRADHVAVSTPGMTTTVQDSLRGADAAQDQLRLRAQQELQAAGRGDETVATVAWLGYQAPQWSDLLRPSRSALHDEAAQRGADRLVPFLEGVDAARAVPPHLTALGHSYGSLTTGLAVQRTRVVDDVAFYGSPGIGTRDADDLRVPDGHRWVLEAEGDLVADTGRFGADPSRLAGLTGLSTADAPHPDGRRLDGSRGHSAYTADGSTSQYNLSLVVAGLTDRVVVERAGARA